MLARARAAYVTALVACTACGSSASGDGPWLLVARDIDGVPRLAQVPAGGGAPRAVLTDLTGEIRSALVVDGGEAVLVSLRPASAPTEVWRIQAGSGRARRVFHGPGITHMEAASARGDVVSLGNGRLLVLEPEPQIVDLEPPRAQHWRTGDVSPDGQRVLAAFGPDCAPGKHPRDCRLEVWGYDRAAPGWRMIARDDAVSAYNPRFLPAGDRLLYSRTVPDPKCGGAWGCGVEDIHAIDWDGTHDEPLHERAWTPRLARDGRTVAAVSTPPGRLFVGALGGTLAAIADDATYAAAWSPDGRWLAYHAKAGPAAILRADGKNARVLDDGRPIGWLARPLPVGAEAPRKPTPAEAATKAADDAVARAGHFRRAGEPLGFLATGGTGAPPDVTALATAVDLDRFLADDARVLAIVPRHAACKLGSRVTWLDDNDKTIVVTNRRDQAELDRNPVQPTAPASKGETISAHFDDAVELIGVDMPSSVRRGQRFHVTMYYRVHRPPPVPWKVFVHFDSDAMRFQGDHEPPCPTHSWKPGDHVVDRFEVTAGHTHFAAATYSVFAGFFTGGPQSWKNVPATGVVPALDNRVRIGTIRLEP